MKKAEMKKNKFFSGLLIVLLPILFLVFYLIRDQLLHLMFGLPPCPVYAKTKLYCPGCGNTRSVAAFLRGDLIASLHYNITPLFVFIILICLYLNLIFYQFDIKYCLLPKKESYYIYGAVLLVFYYIIRNFVPGMIPNY